MLRICRDLIKDYCANCTFAGIRFIADDTKHWFERLVWVVLVILSWYGSALLILSAWNSFINNPISFGVETTYTEWETSMPAVAICETINMDKVYKVADTIWPPDHLLDLEDALKEIAYYRGWSYNLVDICYHKKNPDPLCPRSNFSYYANLIRSDCPKVLRNCTYNKQEFDCCTYFQPIQTEMGTCFIINSMQVKDQKPYPMVCNQKNNSGILSFKVYVSAGIYTLGKEDVPTLTTSSSAILKILNKNRYRRFLTVKNIENDPLIKDNTVKQRACLFHYENDNGLYPVYSYSACTVQCRKQAQIDTCHCNDHFMLNTTESEQCAIAGMACLHANSNRLTTIKPSWAKRKGLVCNCLPSCDETEITIIKDVVTPIKGKAEVDIELAYLPTERFKRMVVRSQLDLVVSIGGTTGLFVGASLLSFVELFFYFTIRFVSNIWMNRRKRKNNKAMLPTGHNMDIIMEDERPQGPYSSSGLTYTTLITYDKIISNRTGRHFN